MRKLYFLGAIVISLTLIRSTSSAMYQPAMPDTTGGTAGWRYAVQADADYWAPNVAVGDVILFGVIATYADSAGVYVSNRSGYPTVGIRKIYTNYTRMPIQGGKKIHIWRGNYGHIDILAKPDATGVKGFVEQNSSESNPIIITNLGGQVQFGNYGTLGGVFTKPEHWGDFSVSGFKYVIITGEYDTSLNTGNAQYPGMNGNLTTEGWTRRFGIMGDRKYKTFAQGKSDHGLGVVARSFLSVKVRGIAALHGFFAGFSIKSDDIGFGDHTKIDIQRCLSGWHEGEGFYLGSTQSPNSVPDNIIICKNNVALFTGAEGIQVDKMRSTSEVKNNFIYKTACFYQVPFQGAHYQENGLQETFVEGNVHTENNIVYSGNAGSITNVMAIEAKSSATVAASEITLSNNLLGPSARSFGYIQKSAGDPAGLVTFYIDHNVIDSIAVPEANDAYVEPYNPSAFIDIANDKNPFYLTYNKFPEGRSFYSRGDSVITVDTGSKKQKAPRLLLHSQFGFDPKTILKFRGVWLTGQYNSHVSNTGAIAYKKGDMVYMLEGGLTRYYKCIQDHSVVKKPSVETGFWQKLTWSGKDEPAYTPLLQANTYYNYKGMGLTYNPANTTSIDSIPPVVTAQQQRNYRVGDTFQFPSYSASDNRDGNVTSKVTYYWKNGQKVQVNGSNQITAHGQYQLVLNAEDNAGNRAEPFIINILVSDQTVVLKNKSQLNFHIGTRANLTTPGNYWTDVAEDATGLKDANTANPVTVTNSILKDTTGTLLPWTLKIDDKASTNYSRFYGVYDNGTQTYAIGNFPAAIVKEGLRLREAVETECHIIFKGLDPTKYYDFRFTGLHVGTGEVNMSVADSLSGQQVTFNVINNTNVYELTNLQPTAQGKISIINSFADATGQTGKAESALAGFIISEKQGFGLIGIGSTSNINSTIAQIHFTYGSTAVTQPDDYWNDFTVTNSNRTYTLTNPTAKDGTTVLPLTITMVRNDTEGFNYNNGTNTGLTTGNDSGVVPDLILQNFAGINSRPANIYISGLNTSQTYAIQTLSNGRSIWAGNNWTVGVTVQGVKQTQNFTPAGGNTSNLLTWNNVSPDANGKILLTLNNETQAFGGINALIVTKGGTAGARVASDATTASTLIDKDHLVLHPIPANRNISVSYKKEITGEISILRIVDLAGKAYPVNILSTADEQWTLDTTAMNGFYIVVFKTDKGIVYRNFVVKD